MTPMVAELFYRFGKALRNYRRPFSLAAQRALRTPEVVVVDRSTGLAFRCRRGADRMFGEIFHDRLYDIPTAPVRADDLVLDIGANHGFAACHFAAKGARVVAFEPSPDVYGRLVDNVRRNELSGRVECVAAAVGAQDGTVLLYESDALGGGMSTTNPAFASGIGLDYRAPARTELRSIGSVLRSLGERRIRLAKIDCEGSELEILAALRPEHLARIDSFAIEYHPHAYALAELVGLLASWPEFMFYKVPATDVENANLHVVRTDVVRVWAGGA